MVLEAQNTCRKFPASWWDPEVVLFSGMPMPPLSVCGFVLNSTSPSLSLWFSPSPAPGVPTARGNKWRRDLQLRHRDMADRAVCQDEPVVHLSKWFYPIVKVSQTTFVRNRDPNHEYRITVVSLKISKDNVAVGLHCAHRARSKSSSGFPLPYP